MKVLVIGSGLIGVTSAYYLKCQGHDVVVVDRASGPGLETSFANGALLTPSMSEPWNAPGSWRVLLASLAQPSSPLKLRLHAIPSLAGWGLEFLRNSEPDIFRRNTLTNLRFAMHSLQVMNLLREHTGVAYGRSAKGTLRLFRDATSFAEALVNANRLVDSGIRFKQLSSSAMTALEPSLAPIAKSVVGAIHYESDETGDAHAFCVALAEYLGRQGVHFHFGKSVKELEVRSSRVESVIADGEKFTADRYVVAAGSYSTPIFSHVGLHLPVRPAKGYSVTFDMRDRPASLRIPVVDDQLHAVVVPVGNSIRAAGTAEFAGYRRNMDSARIRNLLRLACQILPEESLDPQTARPWCGLRPMSADGVPIIGPTPIANLWVNTGHGHLGWTLAAGSAKLLAELVSDTKPSTDPTPFLWSRFR